MHEAASTPFASFALEYDDGTDTVGNLTEVTEIDSGVVSYDYDALYRLTSEAKTGTGSYSKSYGYDVSGNVTTVNSSSFATYDSSNKLSTISGGSVTHDFFGQVKTASGTGLPTSTYTWNVSQRLASQKLGSGSVRNYWYDAFGRLVRTKDTGLATVYIFDGQRVIGEYQDGAPLAVYTWGADGVVARRVLSGGARRWYHYGPQGETRYLTDGSGSVTDTYRYTAYGVPLSSSGSSLNPFRYGGKFGYFYDGFTGILRAGERWYAPHLMRWISRDPILFDGGYNVYEYVSGRVTGYVDPMGLRPLTEREKNFLRPYIPQIDLERADINENGIPLIITGSAIGVTIGNDIYFKRGAYDSCTPQGIALLGHELVHVGQFRKGLTWLGYLLDSDRYRKYERPAYLIQSIIERDLIKSGANCGCG